ncbi:MAG TPA: ATP-dependent helicase HrpB [Kiritimatiellia bacterium]|nr:ATP-dependent helicase HrpB [Kiritimatiellia bacterium]HRU71072.1 ATP-dependent helicase HrpB [Kiritimatiellia bacterium]
MNLFPVDAILPGLAASLAANRSVVLQAPPGTGKTTRVAPFLLDAGWLKGRKILLLEPRRLAARAAAAFMARQRDEPVGDTIGYHIRLERRAGPRTRIELLTEGLLTQRLLHDPELVDTGLVIFDEFHERSLAADTALALALDVRRALRPDLRLAVMSATLRPEAIAAHLGDADIHTANARIYPVETRLLERLSPASIPRQAAGAVLHALREETGSVLVFLPGEGEIRRTLDLLRNADLPPDVSLHPLYGALPREEQDAAVAPPAPGRRKVVLATSIAETSLTIEGIRVVIDTGWMRVPRFSPRNGMSRLETLRITRDRADQRRGRAGRLGPGVCYRLWDEATDRQLAPEALPEILDADLAATVLQAANWGSSARDGLPWFTPPPDATWRQAVSLLQDLGALTSAAPAPAITARGRAMAKLPTHPRLAHMIFEAARDGAAQQACLLAAVITEAASESSVRYETDVRRLLDRVREEGRDGFSFRVHELARRWGRHYPATDTRRLSEGLLLAWAFPDRLARRRDAQGRYLLRNGRGAVIDTADPLARSEWLVVADLLDDTTDAKIRLAAPLDEDEVETAFADQMERRALTFWDKRSEAVVAVNRLCLGAITVREGGQATPDADSLRAALFDGIRQKGIAQLPWNKSARALQARVMFLRRALPEQGWPDLSDDALLADLDTWLGPFCDSVTRWSHVEALDLTAILLHRLGACGCSRHALDTLAPTHLPVPSGSNIQVRYDRDLPYMEVRIQEVFGLTRTPTVAGGRVPVVLHLLSPAHRPVQVTRDLESFWATGYALVRKDLRGRYPKHYWPENPYEAEPTRRVRPRPHS